VRARNIKPGFFTCPELLELPFEARLLFIGLPCCADREGRLEDRPGKIKLQLFPTDAVDVDALLDQLQGAGFIERYEVDGQKLIHVINFTKHQNPHINEKSFFPAPHQTSTVPAPDKHGANPADSLSTDSLSADSPAPGREVTRGWDDPHVERVIQQGKKRNSYAKPRRR
jgi:hypothetical protein